MIPCCLITPRARQWLDSSQEVRILHLFAEVCNLVNEQRQVLSLVSRRIGAGPFALVLADDREWPEDSKVDVKIDRRAQRLYAGRLAVAYGSAPCWQPRPAWHCLRERQPFAETPPKLLPDMAHLLQQLLDGICRADGWAVQGAAARLAGRGAGLTPTGDDLLVGVLYALWVWQPGSQWISVIVEAAAPRTTCLSASFLQAAAAGEATHHWHRLAAGDGAAVSEILATGHSSGAETWAAFSEAGARLSYEPG